MLAEPARAARAAAEPLAGVRVLVVEDEVLICMMIEDTLVAAGAVVADAADRLDRAMDMAARVEADVAVLDMNLAGRNAAPVAALLRQRGMPVVVVSGYGEEGRPDGHGGPVLAKPFEADMLIRAIADALRRPIRDPAAR
jgi:CheY-like chemotaxis protein